MYRVLIPIDENHERAETIVEAVCDLPCAADEIEATVLNVHEEYELPADGEGGVVDSEVLFDEDDVPDSVAEAVAALEDAGIETTVRRVHDTPATAILDAAEDVDADKIVMSGRPRTPTGKVLFGSVTQSVILSSTRPVTVVMP